MSNGQTELDRLGCEYGRGLRKDYEYLKEDVAEIKQDVKTILTEIQTIKSNQDKSSPYIDGAKNFISALIGGIIALMINKFGSG